MDGDLNDSPDQSIAQKSPPGTYSEKTNRILAWVQLLRSIAPVIWALVVLVVIVPLIGQIFIHQAFSSAQLKSNLSKSPVQTVVVQPGIDWTTVNGAIAQSLQTAHESAEAYASAELDQWVGELMDRVDQSFLDWYFSYFNQKTVEFKGVFVQLTAGVANLINPDWPSASERVAETLTRDFQSEFAKRVLKPQIAQLKLERLTQATVQQYLSELSASLTAVPVTYQIPQADWDRYLNDIAISIRDTEGNISTLSLKVLMGGGAYLAVKPLVAPLMLKVGSNMVAKFAGKAGAKIAVKTGASLAGKVAAGLLDSAVGVGILIWDVWDTHHTATLEKPILRQTLLDYLEQVKASILDNPETGIMGAINQIEHRIVDSLNAPELAIKPDEIWD
ncbi:MAG: hypothetical protein HC920_00195 [Oscillatoriales cyanobacterium SM2_3_0]|nr:hypothetical protein [Oscillatoriales cyanobacterium SM2_3_0]